MQGESGRSLSQPTLASIEGEATARQLVRLRKTWHGSQHPLSLVSGPTGTSFQARFVRALLFYYYAVLPRLANGYPYSASDNVVLAVLAEWTILLTTSVVIH